MVQKGGTYFGEDFVFSGEAVARGFWHVFWQGFWHVFLARIFGSSQNIGKYRCFALPGVGGRGRPGEDFLGGCVGGKGEDLLGVGRGGVRIFDLHRDSYSNCCLGGGVRRRGFSGKDFWRGFFGNIGFIM